jgi:hypothetical protein
VRLNVDHDHNTVTTMIIKKEKDEERSSNYPAIYIMKSFTNQRP